MSGYVDELERELIRAGHERQRRSARLGGLVRRRAGSGRSRVRGGVPLSIGGFVGVLSTALTAGIVVLAFVLLGNGRVHSPPTTASGSGVAARQLESMLAILRRPQTAADRAIPASDIRFLERSNGPIVASLTRWSPRAAAPGFSCSSSGRATQSAPRKGPCGARPSATAFL